MLDAEMASFMPDTLPLELLDNIIGYLLVQDKVALIKAHPVWKQYLLNNPRAWYELYYGNLGEPSAPLVLNQNMVAHHHRLAKNGTRLIQAYHPRLVIDFERLRLSRFPDLRHLELSKIWNDLEDLADDHITFPRLEALHLSAVFSVELIIRFLKNCRALKHASFVINSWAIPRSRVNPLGAVPPSLKSLCLLTLPQPYASPFVWPGVMFAQAFALQEFYIPGKHYWEGPLDLASSTKLTTLHLPTCRYLPGLVLPRSLEDLLIPLEVIGNAAFSGGPLPNLRMLRAEYFSSSHMDSAVAGLAKVLRGYKRWDLACQLEIVRLVGSRDGRPRGRYEPSEIDSEIIPQFEKAGRGINVKHLGIWSPGEVGDSVLDAVAKVFPNLETLYLGQDCSPMTERKIIEFVNGLIHLQHLRLTGASRVNSRTRLRWWLDRDLHYDLGLGDFPYYYTEM